MPVFKCRLGIKRGNIWLLNLYIPVMVTMHNTGIKYYAICQTLVSPSPKGTHTKNTKQEKTSLLHTTAKRVN